MCVYVLKKVAKPNNFHYFRIKIFTSSKQCLRTHCYHALKESMPDFKKCQPL